MGGVERDDGTQQLAGEGAGSELSSKPVSFMVALTTRCNSDCIMCNMKEMQWELPEKAVQDVMAFFPYLRRVLWQGGEVFLYRQFRHILQEAARFPRLAHSITTNGQLLNDDWVDLFNRIELDLNISVDGTSKTVYEQIRRGSTFEVLIKNLETLKKKSRNKRRNIVVTVMKENFDKLDGFVKFAEEYEFLSIIFQQARSYRGNQNEEFIFSENNSSVNSYLSEKMRQIKKEAAAKNIAVIDCLVSTAEHAGNKEGNGGSCASDERKVVANELFCNAPWKQLFIGWGGFVYPSCLCMRDQDNEKISVGNICSESLESIWNGDKMQEYRRRISCSAHHGFCNPNCVNGTIPRALRSVEV